MARNRNSAKRNSDSTRPGAADWHHAADSEPLEAFESPRAHEGVLPAPPRRYETHSVRAPLVLPAVWRPANPQPSTALRINGEPRRKPPGASVAVYRTPPRPTAKQRLLQTFRPTLGLGLEGARGTAPKQVNNPCQRREDRRKVIFASGVGGRRRSAPGPYRRTLLSNYGCK